MPWKALYCVALCVVAQVPPAIAGDRLEWTGAVTEIEGAAGGGLVPWALIGGLGTDRQIGASAFFTYVPTEDFKLRTGGVSVDIDDRLELSWARQRFDAGSVIPGLTLGQDIVGAKVRLMGDAVFDADSWLPQIAAGAFFKRTLDYENIPRAIGATTGTDVDLYLAATKMFFAAAAGHNVIVDVTVRRTRANQYGLLGFGGDAGGYHVEPEASAGVWLTDHVLFGGEFRAKPDNLGAFKEDGAGDVFLAVAPIKNVTVTAAAVDLGHIAGKDAQIGGYISLWVGY